jgi:lipid-A-disaccharide synthase-like uncharacterized protein
VFISSFNLNTLQYAHQLGTSIALVYALSETDDIAAIQTTVTDQFIVLTQKVN